MPEERVETCKLENESKVILAILAALSSGYAGVYHAPGNCLLGWVRNVSATATYLARRG